MPKAPPAPAETAEPTITLPASLVTAALQIIGQLPSAQFGRFHAAFEDAVLAARTEQ